MNGPEHYVEAERLLAVVDNGQAADTDLATSELLAMAQVNATLALAAATALQDHPEIGIYTHDRDAWHDAAGVRSEEAES